MNDVIGWIEEHLDVRSWDGPEASVCCPFHDDQNPSANVNSDKAVWFCHKCNRGGKLSDLAKEAGFPPPPLNGRGKLGLGVEVCRYDYRDSEGRLSYQNVRFEPKGFRPYDPDAPAGAPEKEKWTHGGKERIPYHLPELLRAIEKGVPIWITEGEKDANNLQKLGQAATCNDGGWSAGMKYWRGFIEKYFKPGLRIVLCPDADVPGMKLMRHLGRLFILAGCRVKLIDFGFTVRKEHGEDVSDWLKAHTKEDLVQLVSSMPLLKQEDTEEISIEEEIESEVAEGKRKKQADKAIELASVCEYFHDEDIAYARLHINDHYENWKVRSKEFKTWLRRQFYIKEESSIGSQALEDALGVLEGKALFEGPQTTVHIRIAGDDSTIWVDLADKHWRAIRITGKEWTVDPDPPVRFRRAPGMESLPAPEDGGNLDTHLEPYLNMSADDKKLFISCLVAAFRPTGPYPVLGIHGEQGSAKSTAARMFRKLVDPNTASLRSMPREERDMVIAAQNGWIVNFDNLSHLPVWISDALCRIATGSGFGTRQLYTDDSEILFKAQRPVVINGIEDLATRGDLLDRSVLVNCIPLEEKQRISEKDFFKQFEDAKPRILGCLFNAVSTAIKNLPTIKVDSLPRMADFSEWMIAAEPALNWPEGTFLRVYRANRADANLLALEANPIVPVLIKHLEEVGGSWSGTASDLLQALEAQVGDRVLKARYWPKSARALSANIRRVAPNLRNSGMEVHLPEKNDKPKVFRLKLSTCGFASFAGKSGAEVPANPAKSQSFTSSLKTSEELLV